MRTHALDQLNKAGKQDFIAALGEVFEHAPWVAEAAFARKPFVSLAALHQALGEAMRAADAAKRLTLVKGHPDLADKTARAGNLTADSSAEQSSAGLDRLTDAEYAQFHKLNDAYKAKFGFPFIVCARRHGKESILGEFEKRVKNAPDAELQTALAEIMRIAALRLDRRVTAPDKLEVHGRLSTHVLDTHGGRPAAGVELELVELSAGDAARVILRTATNADGRTDRPLIADRPVPIARYELRFNIGAYFRARGAAQGIPLSDPPFLSVVPVRFAVAEPEGHYHVPLLASPWSYTTYRGS